MYTLETLKRGSVEMLKKDLLSILTIMLISGFIK